MNMLLDKGYISELECGENFSYILNNSNDFLSTEYKVLQNQTNSCFVKCMKMLYNGKIQLYYITNTYKPLIAMLPTLPADSFMTIASNLVADIIDVKHNGFLSCQNIDISLEHIFVEPATYKVKLVYLPVAKKIYSDYSIFENEFRTGLIKVISKYTSLAAPVTMKFAADLKNGMFTLEDVHKRIKHGVNDIYPHKKEKYRPEPIIQEKPLESYVRIIALDAPTRVEIDVTKDEFYIGKKPDIVDAAVTFNKLISRRHCKINSQRGVFTITDLESVNGTYLNGIKLKEMKPYPIKDGDIVRLANSDFMVKIV